MPYKVVPALIPYKKGGWSLREPIPSDIECFGEEFVDDTLLVLDFDMNVLDKTEVEVPLFFVNKEARTVALAWIQQHYIEMRSLVREKPTTAFFRSFRYHEDALYVSRANFADFVNEAERKVFIETDLMDRHVKTITPLIKRIALPESVFAIHDDEDTRAWMSVFASQHTVSTSSSEKVSVFCESLVRSEPACRVLSFSRLI